MALPSFRRSAWDKGESLPSREIWEPFSSLRRDMERAFENFSRDFGWSPPALAGMAEAPRVDVSETDSEVKIEAELPGVDEKDVEVVLSEGRLTIKGEKKQETEDKGDNYYRMERSYGKFSRVIPLPDGVVDNENVDATFKNGVLTITLPKLEEAQQISRRITVNAG
jgi:HSP20 family protein